jgi:hypothetical protein
VVSNAAANATAVRLERGVVTMVPVTSNTGRIGRLPPDLIDRLDTALRIHLSLQHPSPATHRNNPTPPSTGKQEQTADSAWPFDIEFSVSWPRGVAGYGAVPVDGGGGPLA